MHEISFLQAVYVMHVGLCTGKGVKFYTVTTEHRT